MLKLILRKMIKNKWLILSLIVGCMLAVSVIASIPMYSDGILQRMLIKDFELSQEEYNAFPAYNKFDGIFSNISNPNDKVLLYNYYNDYIEQRMATSVPMDIMVSYSRLGTQNRIFLDAREWPALLEEIREDKFFKTTDTGKANVLAVDNLVDMVEIVQGTMYTPGKFQVTTDEFSGEVYEAVISSEAMKRSRYSLGGIYTLTVNTDDEEYILNYQIVGVVDVKEEDTSFFTMDYYGVYFDFDTYFNEILNERTMSIGTAEWYYAYDYYQFRMSDAQGVLDDLEDNLRWIDSNYGRLKQTLSFEGTLNDYLARATKLSGLLLLLVIPVILMIGFYVTMIAQLIMEQEKNEIAMLESRGASRRQIFNIYLGESVAIGIISYFLGLFGALLMTRLIGASNGFMEFVNRSAMATVIGWKSIVYGLITALLFILMMLFPAYKASKFTIVQFKQGKAIFDKKPFWQRLYLDVVLLVVASYALFNYTQFKDFISFTEGGKVDYLVFFAVTFFILGVSLVFMRIYPLIVDAVFRLGRRIWTPSMYAAFTYVARGGNMRQFIMIFLILALGVGIFNANSARTINENTTDLIRYMQGTEITLTAGEFGVSESGDLQDVSDAAQKNTTFEIIKQYDGLDEATRVATLTASKVGAHIKVTRYQSDVKLMAITPEEFGKVIWYRDDLYPYHINHYLNFLARFPEGLILSTKLAENLAASPGDIIYIDIDNQRLEGPLLTTIDYWPTYNRYESLNELGEGTEQELCIIHYDNLRASLGDFPSEIWISKKEGVLDSKLNDYLVDNEVALLDAKYTDYEISEAKKDPMLHGMNGILTLDFLVTMIICGAGFIIFWFLSIRQRVLQFGIFRAMGLKKRELISIIMWEQILISAVAIIVGILIGGITSQLFVPLFQIVDTSAERVIPFVMAYNRQDYFRIYALVAGMLAIGIGALSRFTTSIKMDQAVKLGED
ncbi:MAG TPA: FtsX-like permease family protein [Clostridia bacterium]|nr:FtsX-like permease family protein [Clostridia bacterium]